jgi:hypothetical protein
MKKILFILALFLTASSTSWAGGGWPQPKGGGFFKIGQWWVIADRHFTDSGLIDPNVTNSIYNTHLYAEYGLTDRLTGIVYFPFFSRALFNNTVSAGSGEIIQPGEAINGIGDTDISLKYGLIVDKPVVVSASVLFGLPLGISAGGDDGRLQTGDGEFNQMLRVDASTSFSIGEIEAWSTVYAGYNHRTQGFSDEVRFGLEVGGQFFDKRILGIVRLFGIESTRNGTLGVVSNGTSLFANNSEHLTISPEIGVNINEKWGVSANFATALRGEIIFANPSYSVGVFFKM